MKLSRKTVFYSLVLAVTIILLIMAYMYFLLPGLYIDSKHEQNIEDSKRIHREFLQNHSYEGVAQIDSGTGMSFILPEDGYELEILNHLFRVRFEVQNPDLRTFIDQMRAGDTEDFDFPFIPVVESIFREVSKVYPDFSYTLNEDSAPVYNQVEAEYRELPDNTIMLNAGVSDRGSKYTNYILVTLEKGISYTTMVSRMTPLLSDIRPVILRSVPMISLSVLLLVLLASVGFSRSIVEPIERLSAQAENMKADFFDGRLLEIRGHDEIASLTGSLNELYVRAGESYEKLQEENRRQLNFLRATGHELKTPISSALLLTSSMMDGVGSYQDPEKSLPILKNELQGMQRIVEDMLNLNKLRSELSFEQFSPGALLRECVAQHQLLLDERGIRAVLRTEEATEISSDIRLMENIFNNLLANVAKHAKADSTFEVVQEGENFRFSNSLQEPITRDAEELFEPFVSARAGIKSSGLGLYIARYSAGLLDYRLSAEKDDTSILFSLTKKH